MNISVVAAGQNRLIGMLLTVLMVFGVFSYFSLPAREDPQVVVREAVVNTRAPGLSAERVELLVTRTLEEWIRRVPEVEEIRSLSMPERSIIHVEIQDKYFNLDQIWDELRHRVDDARAELPAGIPQPQVNDDFGDVAVLTASLTSKDFPMSDVFDMAQFVRDELYAVEGARRVDILAAQPECIEIYVSESRLAELGVSGQALADQLRSQNVLGASGTLEVQKRRLLVEPTGDFDSVEAIGQLLVRLPDGKTSIPLEDVAQVRRVYADPPQTLAYHRGRPAVVLSVSMLPEESALDFGARAKARLQALQHELPVGYDLSIITYQAEQVARSVYGVTWNVLQTLLIVLGVVILFLGLRTGLIVGSIVPAVMLVTLAIMGFFEMELERMSLATLVIALGLLVDNGIVVAEDFKRRLEEGATRDQALAGVGRELALPLLSSSLTTILVFLPLMMAEHSAGEYTRSISLVVLITLVVSWVLAMTVTPLLSHRFTRVSPWGGSARMLTGGPGMFRRFNLGYERVLRGLLRRPVIFLVTMLVLLIASVVGLRHAPKKFFPDSDRAQILAYVDLGPEAGVEATDEAIQEILRVLSDEETFPEVVDYVGYVGFGGPRFVLSLTPIDPAPNRGFVVVNVDGAGHVQPTIDILRTQLKTAVPEARVRVTKMFLGPSDSTKIEVQAKGPDREAVFGLGERLAGLLRSVPGATDVRSDWEGRVPKVVVDVDQAKARRAGVTSSDVAAAISRRLGGSAISELREGDDVIPILLRGDKEHRLDPSRLQTTTVQGKNGSVPLLQVAEVRLESSFGRIYRENLVRTVTVEGRNIRMTAEDMLPIIADELDALRSDLPVGHEIEVDGVIAESALGKAALAANVPLCLGAMMVLLVAQFRSYRRALIILATIPLLLVGAVPGLYLMNAKFGFMPILGLYSLAGIIINNAIVLIDRVDIERMEGGKSDYEALISASVRRLRPIVMTTVTTILGLLPLIVTRDALFYGMASVMAFGLLVGTILTLGVVPISFRLLFGIRPPRQEVQRHAV